MPLRTIDGGARQSHRRPGRRAVKCPRRGVRTRVLSTCGSRHRGGPGSRGRAWRGSGSGPPRDAPDSTAEAASRSFRPSRRNGSRTRSRPLDALSMALMSCSGGPGATQRDRSGKPEWTTGVPGEHACHPRGMLRIRVRTPRLRRAGCIVRRGRASGPHSPRVPASRYASPATPRAPGRPSRSSGASCARSATRVMARTTSRSRASSRSRTRTIVSSATGNTARATSPPIS